MSDIIERLTTALGDRYAIEREIGEGGMAIVYLATDLRHQRKVALKVLRPELAATLGTERFLQEVRVTANLQHPHILPLFDSGEADGFLFYVMPYLEGESLRERVARESELPIGQAVTILKEVADALAAAHQMGVVHRDIKPDNVMLSGRHAVVTDFGVAKAGSEATGRHELTTKGVALGTPTYMAPEQAAANEHIDHRVDIYAVGVMGYELLAGRPPFSGRTAQQVLAAHVTEVPRDVTDLRSAVPPALGAVIMRCLEKKPADRWQTAEELLGQLEAFATPSTGVTPTQTYPLPTEAVPLAGPPAWRKIGIPALVVASIAAAAFGVTRATGGREAGSIITAGVEADIRLVVLPLENLTSDPELDVWGKLAADQMARAIDQPRPVPVVPSSTVAAAIRGLGDAATTESVAEAVKATHAFAGTVSTVGGQMRFEVELIDVRSGDRLRTLDVISGPSSAADSLVATLAGLSATVAVAHLDPGSPPWLAGATIPVSLTAFEAYLEQSEIFCTGDNAGSLGPGMRAVELSPGFNSAIYLLMVAHGNLGNNFEADSLIDILDGTRAEMTRQERLNLDWMTGNRTGDPGLAQRAVEELYRLDPVGAGVGAMLSVYRDLRMNDAIERLESADLDQACRWPGAWLQGSIAYHTLGRFDDELALARHGLGYYPRMRRMVEVAARSMAALGRVDAVDSLVNVMANLPPEERREFNFRTFYTAMELGAHGFREESARLMTDVLDGWVVNRPPLNDRYNHA